MIIIESVSTHSPYHPAPHRSLVGFCCYIAIGMAIGYRVKGARGIEMVPQLAFWKDLPFLIKVCACSSYHLLPPLSSPLPPPPSCPPPPPLLLLLLSSSSFLSSSLSSSSSFLSSSSLFPLLLLPLLLLLLLPLLLLLLLPLFLLLLPIKSVCLDTTLSCDLIPGRVA